MLESFTSTQVGQSRQLAKLLVGSVCTHGLVLTLVLVLDSLRVTAVPAPAAVVTFVEFAPLSLPPPPPLLQKKPRPVQAVLEQQKSVRKIKEIKASLAPKSIPAEKPLEPEAKETPAGVDNGALKSVENAVQNGAENGVPGGIAGSDTPIAAVEREGIDEPPPPSEPVFQPMAMVKMRLIKGSDPEYPQNAREAGLEATIAVHVLINPDGEIASVKFLKTEKSLETDRYFEPAVRAAIASWKFSPLLIGGRTISTVTIFKFVFKLY